jgi:hypothetical protein
LKEAPLLWAKECDRRLKDLIIQVPTDSQKRGGKDENDKEEKKESFEDSFEACRLKRLATDVNTWHILNSNEEVKGILLTYVDDLMVIADTKTSTEGMKAVDSLWKCSPEEVVLKSGPPVTFCGICIQRKNDGYSMKDRTSKTY